ncbi:MAG: hypothetical protein LBC96_02410 [Lachnospiraceae bacterium]|nr:hypothetical protein [Lachnospiraceae bacterium]
MNQKEREQYWIDLEDKFLKGGAAFSEWCSFIAKDTFAAFVHGADLSTTVMALACVETYLKTENPDLQNQPLYSLVDKESALSCEEKEALNKLRHYRNKWVHTYDLDDDEIVECEAHFIQEAEEMACLAVKMMLTILFLNQYV